MTECDYFQQLVLGVLFIISELLPFINNKESCNGIANTLVCALMKCKDENPDDVINGEVV
tara:strand:+ start:833 stop:1012 length:180 start_codon:yes stop_codon:yes gene_type:complete